MARGVFISRYFKAVKSAFCRKKTEHTFGRNGKIEYAHVIMVSRVIIIIIQGRFIARLISILASAIAGRSVAIEMLCNLPNV